MRNTELIVNYKQINLIYVFVPKTLFSKLAEEIEVPINHSERSLLASVHGKG